MLSDQEVVLLDQGIPSSPEPEHRKQNTCVIVYEQARRVCACLHLCMGVCFGALGVGGERRNALVCQVDRIGSKII